MLLPKSVKHRSNIVVKCVDVQKVELNSFGEFGLQAVEASWITNRQIESARIAMTRYMKRGGKVWIKIFPHKPLHKNL